MLTIFNDVVKFLSFCGFQIISVDVSCIFIKFILAWVRRRFVKKTKHIVSQLSSACALYFNKIWIAITNVKNLVLLKDRSLFFMFILRNVLNMTFKFHSVQRRQLQNTQTNGFITCNFYWRYFYFSSFLLWLFFFSISFI